MASFEIPCEEILETAIIGSAYMSLFNTVAADLACPRCGRSTTVEAQVQAGDTSQKSALRIGDLYPWRTTQVDKVDSLMGENSSRAAQERARQAREGARPAAGDTDLGAWCLCSICRADFFATVSIRADRVAAVTAAMSRFPLGPDGSLETDSYCSRCASDQRLEVRLFAGSASPCRELKIGDVYLPDYPDLTITLRALGLCGSRGEHELVLLVGIQRGLILSVRIDPDQAKESPTSEGSVFLPSSLRRQE